MESARQILCSMRDFEPYTAFRRLDRLNLQTLDNHQLCAFLQQAGYREFEASDCSLAIRYFAPSGKLNYQTFLQVVLPCDDTYLRAAAAQRPANELPACEFLDVRIEKALSQLLYKEVRFHIKLDLLKRKIENQYDFNARRAF